MRARAVNPRKRGEMTKAEIAFRTQCDWLNAFFDHVRYESHTLRFGELRYTPDFTAVRTEDGQVCHFEVKPAGHRHVYTDAAKIKLKTFSSEYGEYVFFLVWPDKTQPRGWHIEPGSRDPAESVLHAGFERPLHLATTLLTKQQVVCFVGRSRA